MMISHKKLLVKHPKKCPRCGKGPVLEDLTRGEFFCNNCGYVIKESVVDTRPEWRAFTKEEREEKARVGMPSSLAIHDRGLATKLGAGRRDVSGRLLNPSERRRINRMRMWDRRSQMQVPLHRNLLQALTELNRIADKLKVSSSIVERAAYIYRKALKKDLVKGRSISSIITASIYAACRESSTPRTLKDVAKASGIKRKDLARSYRLILRELDLKMPVLDPAKCVSRIASKVGISERTSRKALRILDKAKRAGVSAGKDPMGLAGSALYIACLLDGKDVTQEEIGRAAGVTEVTIRNRYKSLRKIVNLKDGSNKGELKKPRSRMGVIKGQLESIFKR
ncbi:MAG: transcription initiation factor IIB [Candidatus Methylarchaceae archaeon HK02M1]|nr:transcription initiation factor IIB [Candidatus Methylarchaceae archaeon HK02M1]